MYLASLISNLFTSYSPQLQNFAQPNNGSPTNILGLSEYDQGRDTSIKPGRRKEQVRTMEKEEEARPPYPQAR